MKKRMIFMAVLGLVALLMTMTVSIAVAGQYPERPVECIVPWGVGGGSTLFARAFLKPAEKFLGQPIPIVNISGAGGAKGTMEYLKRPADGYSIISLNSDNVLGSVLGTYKGTIDQIDGIARAVLSNIWIFVRKESPFKTFKEVMDYAKKNPDKLKFGVEGISSNEAIAHAKLAKMGVKTRFINYDGGTEMHSALLRGEIDLACGIIESTASFVNSGQFIPLVVGSAKRVPGWDLPTMKELGIDMDLSLFRGIGIKKGADPVIRKTLEDAFIKASNSEEWKEFMASKKLDPKAGFMNSEDFNKYLEINYQDLKGLVRETGYMVK